MPDEQTIPQRITVHLSTNPLRTAGELVEALGIGRNTVATALGRLRKAGLARRVFEQAASGPDIVRWELGIEAGLELEDELDHAADHPKQTTVTSWPLHMVRDPLVAALVPINVQGRQYANE